MSLMLARSPFALSMSKGFAERSEVPSPRSGEGFDFAQPERTLVSGPEADHG
ncbi:hypothetical protein WG907_13210 [Sphingobium sp. AN558]|uniref:hypothetical protein n=1 Tax=Sphingobium sp. AN558 TaxID=3133442 RepID=UPI0030C615DB